MQNNEQRILRLITQYNNNQEDYNRNMRSLIQMLQRENRDHETYTFEIGITDMANTLMSMLDPSRNNLAQTGLSPTEISEKTTVYIQSTNQNTFLCPITLEQVQIGDSVMRINRCQHRFKSEALRQWLTNHRRCPLCRGEV
jgi:hypothetical protein